MPVRDADPGSRSADPILAGYNLRALSKDLEKLQNAARISESHHRSIETRRLESLESLTRLGFEIRDVLEAPVGKDILEHVRFIMETRAEYLGRMHRFENDRDAARASESRQRAIVAALKNDVAALGRKLEEQIAKTEAMTEAAFDVVGMIADKAEEHDKFVDDLLTDLVGVVQAHEKQAELIGRLQAMTEEVLASAETSEASTRNGTDSVYG